MVVLLCAVVVAAEAKHYKIGMHHTTASTVHAYMICHAPPSHPATNGENM